MSSTTSNAERRVVVECALHEAWDKLAEAKLEMRAMGVPKRDMDAADIIMSAVARLIGRMKP